MLYGSETWPIKVEESQRLHHNEMSMIRWMCSVTMRDRYPCEELRAWVGIKPIVDVMRQRHLHWFGHIERRCKILQYMAIVDVVNPVKPGNM